MAAAPQGAAMQALKELFTTDVGLLSIGVIVFMLGMGGFYLRYFIQHMHADEAAEKARLGR
jgi:hypothetical protein